MYQWKENQTTRREGDQEITEYTYERNWYETRIDSSSFRESGYENPTNEWPFQTMTQSAQNVTMGKFRLNASQVERLGQKNEDYEWEDEGENAIAMTVDQLSQNGFTQFTKRGNYFVASTDDGDEEAPHIGQYRVKFHYNQCGTATIMAQ